MKVNEKEQKPKQSAKAKQSREQKLAKALRENLLKRKQQLEARKKQPS